MNQSIFLQFAPNIQPVSGEKEQAKEVLKHLLTKKPRLLDHTMTTVAGNTFVYVYSHEKVDTIENSDYWRDDSAIMRFEL